MMSVTINVGSTFKVTKGQILSRYGICKTLQYLAGMLKADYDAEFRVSKYKEDGDEAVMAVGVV